MTDTSEEFPRFTGEVGSEEHLDFLADAAWAASSGLDYRLTRALHLYRALHWEVLNFQPNIKEAATRIRRASLK